MIVKFFFPASYQIIQSLYPFGISYQHRPSPISVYYRWLGETDPILKIDFGQQMYKYMREVVIITDGKKVKNRSISFLPEEIGCWN